MTYKTVPILVLVFDIIKELIWLTYRCEGIHYTVTHTAMGENYSTICIMYIILTVLNPLFLPYMLISISSYFPVRLQWS